MTSLYTCPHQYFTCITQWIESHSSPIWVKKNHSSESNSYQLNILFIIINLYICAVDEVAIYQPKHYVIPLLIQLKSIKYIINFRRGIEIYANIKIKRCTKKKTQSKKKATHCYYINGYGLVDRLIIDRKYVPERSHTRLASSAITRETYTQGCSVTVLPQKKEPI